MRVRLPVAKFLITYLPGDMAQDRDTITAARRELVRWADKTGFALIDAGAPIRSTTTLTRDGTSCAITRDPLMGWSVINVEDRDAALRLLQDHPLLALGAVLQINEPV
jgi:hypothetical protein